MKFNNCILRDPSGSMKIDTAIALIFGVDGHLEEAGNYFYFVPDKGGKQRLEVVELPFEYKRLFQHLSDESITVTVKGDWDPPLFHTTDLIFKNSETATMIRILLKRVGLLPADTQIKGEELFKFDSPEKARAFLTLAGDTVPAGIRDWVEYNLHYRNRVTSTQERGHVNRALWEVLSIDWTQEVVPSVPPIAEVEKALNRSLYGMTEVKEVLLEVLCEVKTTKRFPQYGILLVGPPGVGKTSIIETLCDILGGLPVIRIPMSMLCDIEALTGTPRVYENACTGVIGSGLVKARRSGGVMFFDELDKADANTRGGDPRNLLINLIDNSFHEVYWDLTITTRNLVIATANTTDTIPDPILNRFMVVRLPAYGHSEKDKILKQHVLPDTMYHMDIHQSILSEDAVEYLLETSAYEPGVRELQKSVQRCCRHWLLQMERCENSGDLVLSRKDVEALVPLPNRVEHKIPCAPGVARALVWGEHKVVKEAVIQALVLSGGNKEGGQLKIVGAASEEQKTDITLAYYATRSSLGGPLDRLTLIINAIAMNPDDQMGLAAYMAIVSAIRGEQIPVDAAFIGDVDLCGNIIRHTCTCDMDERLEDYAKEHHLHIYGSDPDCFRADLLYQQLVQ